MWWAKNLRLPFTPRSFLLIWLRDQPLESYFNGTLYHPAPITNQERIALKKCPSDLRDGKEIPLGALYNFPLWLEAPLRQAFPQTLTQELEALSQPAPFDLRVNPLKKTRDQAQKELTNEGYETEPMLYSPYGLRSLRRFPLDQLRLFKQGEIEVQDEGSQLVCSLVEAHPSHQVLDLCAGAGGKTLLLAAIMKNRGHIVATDVHDKRLMNCKKRLKRASVQNAHCQVIIHESDPSLAVYENKMDRVLVDAPCSGTGTWRRNPDLKWRLAPEDLDELVLKQRDLLKAAATYVKPGGRLIYATCSFLKEENENQIDKFCTENLEFTVDSLESVWNSISDHACPFKGDYLRMTPYVTGTDGFFAAVLRKKP